MPAALLGPGELVPGHSCLPLALVGRAWLSTEVVSSSAAAEQHKGAGERSQRADPWHGWGGDGQKWVPLSLKGLCTLSIFDS